MEGKFSPMETKVIDENGQEVKKRDISTGSADVASFNMNQTLKNEAMEELQKNPGKYVAFPGSPTKEEVIAFEKKFPGQGDLIKPKKEENKA